MFRKCGNSERDTSDNGKTFMKRINEPIDLGKRQSGTIDKLLDGYMSKFTVYQSPRIFDMYDEMELIKSGVCPICECKLKVSKKGDVYCRSVKHKSITKKNLFISRLGMEKIK